MATIMSRERWVNTLWAGQNGLCRQQFQIGSLVQDCSNSIANALELLQSCTKPSKCAGMGPRHLFVWWLIGGRQWQWSPANDSSCNTGQIYFIWLAKIDVWGQHNAGAFLKYTLWPPMSSCWLHLSCHQIGAWPSATTLMCKFVNWLHHWNYD